MPKQTVKLCRLIISISSVIFFSKHHFFQTESQKSLLFAVFSFLEQFLSSSIVVAVAKANQPLRFLLETGQERIQILRHSDWLSVSSFVY